MEASNRNNLNPTADLFRGTLALCKKMFKIALKSKVIQSGLNRTTTFTWQPNKIQFLKRMNKYNIQSAYLF